jgi:spermidine synthase
MAVDRIKIGDSYGDVDMKQQGLAHFPFLLMPERSPRTILSIGLGTGILVGETAKHPSVQTLDCVEIAPTVIEGARLFDEFNDKVLDNNTVQIICDDGVNFLRRTATRYDAIISDAKSRTSHAGNALFFSEDYYQLCHEHLERGGVMIQWVPLNVPHEELPIILRTFLRVFRYSYVWLDPPGSCFLVGTKEKLVLDIPHIQRVLDEQRTADLRRYGWSNAYGFVSLLTADYESLAGWLSDGNAINSLEHPILEFYSPRAFAVPENERVARNLESLLEVRQDPLRNVTLIDGDMTAVAANARAAARLIAGVMRLERQEPGSVREGLALLDEALALAPDHGRLQYTAANAYFGRANELALQGQADAAVAYLRRAVAARPDFAEARFNLANALATRQRYGEAASHYRQVIEVMPDFAGAHFNLANVLASQGEYSDAAVHYRRTLRLRPDLKSARERLNRVLQLERQSQPPGRQ